MADEDLVELKVDLNCLVCFELAHEAHSCVICGTLLCKADAMAVKGMCPICRVET
jgi:hypothetical protein